MTKFQAPGRRSLRASFLGSAGAAALIAAAASAAATAAAPVTGFEAGLHASLEVETSFTLIDGARAKPAGAKTQAAAPPPPPPPAPTYAVGDTIVNPVDGTVLIVREVFEFAVRASSAADPDIGNLLILTSIRVGDIISSPGDPTANPVIPPTVREIASVTLHPTNGLVISVTFVGGDTRNVVTVANFAPPGAPDAPDFVPGVGDANNLIHVTQGAGGRGGSTGALFVSAGNGRQGGAGGPLTVEVAASEPDITTVSDNLPGIVAVSIGGNGGRGGSGYAGASGGGGGSGGAGGDVVLTSRVGNISTGGDRSHGVVAQSRSGIAGAGGTGYLFSSGGAGGAGSNGGSATVFNYSSIQTTGVGSIGVFAQSLGGGAGAGGGSYGVFGAAGDGDTGGNGGSATAWNFGQVGTRGDDAYGVSAQSIGGIGGNSGNSAGLVTFTSNAAPGGSGGTATIHAQTGSSVNTAGNGAYGLFAQSVGGGGGNGGFSAGFSSLGSNGGAGGDGAAANIYVQELSFVTTTGDYAHGVFAQSIGGGGGNSGVTSGVVSFGGNGSGGGVGGVVTVESDGVISTDGLDSRGIFAQSVGGGGGTALGTGGLVSFGGSGGAGGRSSNVSVTTLSNSSVTTLQRGSDGIFVQSVGGGGGAGSTSGGVFAMGGRGGNGGGGGNVFVDNGGMISTSGAYARGIFAQSIGGGGGAGGDAGGLVAVGGGGGAGGGVVGEVSIGGDGLALLNALGLVNDNTGGQVDVTNHGTITTRGNMASAIQAQSVGGGGGDGGSTGGVFVTIGGGGGAGGDSGVVNVDNYGNLSTGVRNINLATGLRDRGGVLVSGNDSHGIFAQSVGGGGGSGGSSTSVSLFAGLAIGGDGAAGGNGGQVNVHFHDRVITLAGLPVFTRALIETQGDRARGLFAQSVGGGGGSGGFASQTSIGFGAAVSVAIGGSGSGGGLGGEVNVDGDADIHTVGNSSEGMLIQSVGGGGGSGGFSSAVAVSASPGPAVSLAVSIGGSAGAGGEGGTVNVDAGGSIFTEGEFSNGFQAQSVGGGGGSGGFSISAAVAVGAVAGIGIGVGVGGSGGAGGEGGEVDASFDGTITTLGDDALGALIQSVGGGGGTGGYNVTVAVGAGAVGGAGVGVGVGGSGGSGGDGGLATGSIGDLVETYGARSTGVLIQSVGGGGGNGGFNITATVAAGGAGAGAIGVGVGGSGDGGGDGGTVNASASSITTHGNLAGGFLAQSVGGGGGNGAMNITGTLSASGGGAGGIGIGLGGSGAGGGVGGNVTAFVNGDVTTYGMNSNAVVAQSVGGGGGGGGLNVTGTVTASSGPGGSIGVGLGGSGGGGGDAGDVTLRMDGTTRTLRENSLGIVAQSVGGGGGSGGTNITATLTASLSAAGSIGVGLGGAGGAGGDAGVARLSVNPLIADLDNTLLAAHTAGDNATAIVAQSVGGGGGSGAVNITAGLTVAAGGAGSIGVGIGGAGGAGGDSFVTVPLGDPEIVMASARVNGDVVTLGDNSAAIFVQSLGGGGGNGGLNVTGGITGSTGASGSIQVGLGGLGGDGGNAGRVEGNVTADIRTGRTDTGEADGIVLSGHGSSALTFQSLGGGGGNGGVNVSGGMTLSGGSSGTIGVGIGGFGGDGGFSSTVDASFSGTILTVGDQAHGILLQSLGGGGGNGGMNVSAAVNLSAGASGAIGFGMGGFGGGAGYSGDVFGDLDGDVVTFGDESFGAVLQSIGGGGGNGGINVGGALAASTSGGSGAIGIGIGGFGGDGGASADVWGTVSGTYITHGANSGGVLAQSQAGGGGNGGLNVAGAMTLTTGTGGNASIGIGGFGGNAASTAGNVDLTRIGDTWTSGAGSDGVTAQSLGGGGGNGGINVSGGIAATQGSNASFGFGLGGFGGQGGAAGDVTANIQGNVIARGLASDVTTSDLYATILGIPVLLTEGAGRVRAGGSNGVVVQSQGGGGGNGGINVTGQISISGNSGRAVSLGIGGFGGGGGNASLANLTLGTDVDRFRVEGIGDDRSAVIVQSIGGGGGNGGINVSGGISTNGNIVAGIGGFGADGGTGGAVTAFVNADLFAAGRRARGLLAQSVGGGGGTGGINISGGINAAGSANSGNDSSLTFGLGGFGGAGNRADTVDVEHHGDVFVEGEQSVGVLVQSVGGGGGAGGLNVSGNMALGSSNGYAVAVGIGGFAGGGDDAGNVSLISTGNVVARNQAEAGAGVPDAPTLTRDLGNTTGILVQSVGGGGGQGGVNITGVASRGGNPIAAGVGGFGGSGGNAGTVTVSRGYDAPRAGAVAPTGENFGVIQTFGDDSFGLIAQSIGGGGGDAGMNFSFIASRNDGAGSKAANITIGGTGAGAGSGNTVRVDHFGLIQTTGQDSVGLLAQSLGGGGGNANYNLGLGYLSDEQKAFSFDMGGGAGAAGTGGAVFVDHNGTILTEGEDSVGLLAQSIGGGGGNAAFDLVEALEDVGFEEYLGGGGGDSLDISIGRRGGSGGSSGQVDVNANGLIQTQGLRSSGVMAQSLGGGGGNSGTTSVGASSGGEVNVAVGLEGGIGAFSGNVTVNSAASIYTEGQSAHGIHAQSIGGGGGAGGSSSNFRSQAEQSMAIAVGGSGGSGNISGQVAVRSDGLINTLGGDSDGILAQSIGGGGGTGGSARTFSNQSGGDADEGSLTLTVNVGGSGSNGSAGNTVDVINTGYIFTADADSNGIRAQSIGGGGGNGGLAINGSRQGSGDSTDATFNLGGSGAVGGPGRAVTVTNEGLISTGGSNSTGITAQSIGGGGGNAGLVIDAVFGGSSGAAARRTVMNIGGSGGAGGTSGDVTVFNRSTAAVDSGQIYTIGEQAYGIFAQSLSGGGGNGSSILAFTALAGSAGSSVLGLNIGGQGGVSGTAGNVRVENDGFIQTTGAKAHGIFAQSAAGGGGNGGLVLSAAGIVGAGPGGASLISVGGQGGDGGDAGNVTVENTGNIVTYGVRAHGILAQSIGGGGGNAQLAIGGGTNGVTQAASGALNTLLGAVNSSSGGRGGTVTVNHTGNITVMGDGSQAIKAESINGGGGSVTFEIVDVLASIPGVSKVVDLAESAFNFARLGGTGVSDMSAGSVFVDTSGNLGAGGDNGAGAVGQSIGGGGGTSGLRLQLASETSAQSGFGAAVGPVPTSGIYAALGGVNGVNNSGALLTTSHTGDILTDGSNSMGLLMQSIGGGGGRSNIYVDAVAGSQLGEIGVTLGSTNGTIEAGGMVTRLQAGRVSTIGNNSTGAILQSLGGGGGSSSVTLVGAGALGSTMLAALGSDGGTALDGAAVSASFSGGIFTGGAGSTGLLAQSIGAGGGEVRASGVSSLEATLGGLNGAAGDGGEVSLVNDGVISTGGARSHGVLLQSIGGGGGAVLTGAQTSIALNDGGVGDGGAILFTQAGDIITQGDGAFGAILQSLGGGGGWVDGVFAGSAGGAGRGGAINFAIDGTIWAVGLDSTGVLAQSTGHDGGGDMLGQLTGLVRGGSGTGRGLWIDGGGDNVFTTSGSISAVSNRAIEASSGNDAVINTGLVVGNIDLGSGVNSFDNQAGSTFIALNTINLRDAAPVTPVPLVLHSVPRVAASPLAASPLAAEVAAAWAQPVAMDALDPAKLGETTAVVGAASTPPVLVNLDQAMSSLNQLMADPAPAGNMMAAMDLPPAIEPATAKDAEPVVMATFERGAAPALIAGGENAAQSGSNLIAVMDLPPVIDSVPAHTGLTMIAGGDNAAQTGSVETAGRGEPVVMAALDPGLVAIVIDGGAEAALPESSETPKGEEPVVMATPNPGVAALMIDGGAEAAQPESVEIAKDVAPVVMAVLEANTDPAPTFAAPAPAFAGPAIAAATFSNSGDFQMGLSASTLPIDLLNGDQFANLDALGDPSTNLYYGLRVINTVALDGHFEQTASGHLAFDIAYGPYASDRVDVTGTATVDGTGDVILTWLENADPVTLFAADGGGTDNGLEITDTMAVDFSIAADGAGVHLLIETDFGLPSLNRNGQAMGGHMDSAILSGGSAGIGRLSAFLGNMQVSELDLYEAIFTELNPEAHVAALHGQLASANTMASDLFNCGTVVSSQDDQCVWSRMEQSTRDQDASFENFSVASNSTRFTGGFQQPLGQDWSLAFAIGYEEISQTLVDQLRARSSGQGFTAGLGMERHSADGYNYGFSVSGGWTWLETERAVTVFETGIGVSEPQTGHLRLDGHVGNLVRRGSYFAAPSLNVGLTALRHDGLTETGLEGLGVTVMRDTQLIASLNPVLRLGHVFHESETRTGTVSLTMGARLSSVDQIDIPVRFTGANPRSDPAMISTVLDQRVYQLGADINIVGNDRVSVSFGYNAEFGEETEHHRTGLDFRLRF